MKKIVCALLLFLLILQSYGCNSATEQEDDSTAVMALTPSEDAEESDILLFTDPPPTATPAPTPSHTPTLPPYSVEQLDEKSGYVTASGVNLRSGPNTAYEVLSVLDTHTKLTVIGQSEEWYQVKYQDSIGFLSNEFVAIGAVPTPKATPKPFEVTKMSSTLGYVNSGTVNFRSGPGRSYDIIAECERYDKLTITGTSGDWYRVKYNKKTGYILKSYVRIGLSPKNYASVGSYTSADVLILAQIAYRENARGVEEGYKAVASVVLNRVHSGKYPNTIEKVVFQGNGAQFSPAENANKLRLTKPSDLCVKAVSEVLKNGSTLPSNVMYFRTASKGTNWGSTRVYYGTYGGNCYFS